jgi:hypothetical protein
MPPNFCKPNWRPPLLSKPEHPTIVTLCKVSLRGYEPARILQGEGMAVWPYGKAPG